MGMPTNPLYYQPLVRASARSIPLGESTLDAVANKQGQFRFQETTPGQERQIMPITEGAAALTTDPQFRAGIEKTFTGLTALTDARRGARLEGVQLALDNDGYLANRAFSVLSTNPNLFDTDTPDQAAQRTGGIVDQIRQGGAVTSITGGVLDLPPAVTSLLQQSWKGEVPVAVTDAAMAALQVNREIEKAATPAVQGLKNQDDVTNTTWLSGSAATTLAMWNGSTSTMTKALGFAVDDTKVEEAVTRWRTDLQKVGPESGGLTALNRLLGMAGLDPAKADQLAIAHDVLQSPDGQIHVSLAARIIDNLKLPVDKTQWLSSRIVDLGGRPGNIDGLQAEVAKLLPPTNPEPPAPTPTPAST
ncbi:MAG: hypothetical protein H7123_05395, partial [Thermoleophilia bacterium]|nr:hypothetical protein [Thermoleophilia bacterium]